MLPLHSKGRNLLEVQTENALTDGQSEIFLLEIFLLDYMNYDIYKLTILRLGEVDAMGQAESRAYWKCKTCNFTIYAGAPPESLPGMPKPM